MKIENPSTWMSTLDGNLTLKDICMPASHDSGMYDLPWGSTGIFAPSVAKTQSKNIKEQLDAGVRYLDIRVGYVSDGYIFKTHELLIMHDVAKGPYFKEVLKDIESFMKDSQETLIVYFSHLDFGPNKEKATTVFLDIVEKYLSPYLISKATVGNRKFNNITLSEMRGKIVAIIDRGEGAFDYGQISKKNLFAAEKYFDSYDSYANAQHFETMRSNQMLKFQREAKGDVLFSLDWTLTCPDSIKEAFLHWKNIEKANEINPRIINPDEATSKYMLNPNQHGHIVNLLSVDYVYPWTLEVCKKIFDNRNNKPQSDIDVFENCGGDFVVDKKYVHFRAFNTLYQFDKNNRETRRLDPNCHGALAVDDKYVYFNGTEDGGELWRVNKEGAPKATRLDPNCHGAIAVDDKYVYFNGNKKGGELWRVNKDGSGGATRLDPNCHGALAVDDKYVYFSGNKNGGELWRVNKDGTGATRLDPNCHGQIALDDEYVYFKGESNSGGLWKVKKDGTNKAVKLDDNCCGGIAVDDTFVYFNGEPSGGGLYKVKKTGGAVAEKLFPVNVLDNDKPIRIDDEYIYGAGHGRGAKLFRIEITK